MDNFANDFEPSSLVVQQTEIYYVARIDARATHSELGPIIGDNIIRHAEPVHDLSDEFHRLSSCDGSCRLYFDPFGEFIHCHEDVYESTFGFL
jgi:hypothetical protein